MALIQRVILPDEPYKTDIHQFPWDRGRPDANWIAHPESDPRPFYSRFRLALQGPLTARIHVTADERYHLFLDGELIYRGPERGDEENWYFETFDLALPDGAHELSALVWSLGDQHAPFGQVIVEHGFLVISDNLDLATGHGKWMVQKVDGIEMIPRTATYGCGDRFRLSPGTSHPLVEPNKKGRPFLEGSGDTQPTRTVRHAKLPKMVGGTWPTLTIRNLSEPKDRNTAMVPILATNDIAKEHGNWTDLFAGKPLTIPAHTRRRVLVDLENYVCAYWHLGTSGGDGSLVRIHFQEALWDDPAETKKGNRNAIEGKMFCNVWHKVPGEGDEVLPAGTDQHWQPLWWLAGRYVELYVETKDEPLTLNHFSLEESHYPLIEHRPFECSDPKLNHIVDICVRTLEMDMHQTYMDTPFYEQLMYVGDTRVEAMCTMAMTDDDRLPRKATELFFWSRGPRGITQSRYPSRNRQYIPPFSLFWVMMVEDQLHWRGDLGFARRMLTGVRSVLDTFEQLMDEGLMRSHPQWNFLDWIPGWSAGVPPQGLDGFNTTHNLQLVLALESAIRLEAALSGLPRPLSLGGEGRGEGVGQVTSYARHLLQWHQALCEAILGKLVSGGFLVDGLGADTVSEHPHALASLSTDNRLVAIGKHWYDVKPKGPRATYYFQHYRFEALAHFGRHTEILADIRQEWGAMVDLGLKTCLESPDPSRSDCHAWSSHPILHLQQSIAGMKLVGPFRYVFEPHLCDLQWSEAHVATGKGLIHVRVDANEARIQIPEGVTVFIPKTNQEAVGPDSVLIQLK